jgi:hypothetical protein
VADDAISALDSVRAIGALLLVATATIALIGLSPDRADRYARAAAALDSLPAYPCTPDTAGDPLSRNLAECVLRVDSVLRSLDPLQPTYRLSALDLLTVSRRRPEAASSSVSSDLVPVGTRIELAPDRTVASRTAFLEAVRGVEHVAAPNMDSLAEGAYARLDSFSPPGEPLTIDYSLDPSDADGKWLETARVHVKVRAYVTPDSTHVITKKMAAWRGSFVLGVPADSSYFVAVRSLSWRMMPYFQRQQWLGNSKLPTSVRWVDYPKFILRPLSPTALAPLDRIKPVLLEVAEMELPAARRFLHERAEALRERGSVTILGLTLENGLAVWIVPLIFASLALLMLIHLLHARGLAPNAREPLLGYPWAPVFPGWKGALPRIALFLVYPIAAALLFARRMQHVDHGWAAISFTAVAVAANLGSLVILSKIRRYVGGAMQ